MPKKLSYNEFVEKSIDIHGHKYLYGDVTYINNRVPVTIICHKHGRFSQIPFSHLQGKGCKKCYDEEIRSQSVRLSLSDFIKRSSKIHNGKYNYEKVKFNNVREMVSIICPVHGEFLQRVDNHASGIGCNISYQDDMKKSLDKLEHRIINVD